ncbi:hypothetical protein [Sphingomonas solaris]|uniref:Uncharacterized protein n=1 Tax=Alterirhizorhabdus solaris TaxID=2529389 RepID=A0A558QS31_9SPHN|nr:hypothetical protein [Sphingomonas solaris]TVV69951.1 hypothetical protein FOY91_20320 [Sphingomonas solaris]
MMRSGFADATTRGGTLRATSQFSPVQAYPARKAPMPLTIHRHRPPNDKGGAAAFYAEDEHGPLEVWVTFERWGALWMLTPKPATDEQRLEFGFTRWR